MGFLKHLILKVQSMNDSYGHWQILLHISEHSDHPFRDYTIADFAIIRSPIPRFSGHF